MSKPTTDPEQPTEESPTQPATTRGSAVVAPEEDVYPTVPNGSDTTKFAMNTTHLEAL